MTVADDPRFAHHRGPCRGDGYRRRSVEWTRMRDEAETRPCPFEIPAVRKRDEPWRCGADVGETCRNRKTGAPLDGAPAHNVRMHPQFARATPEETP